MRMQERRRRALVALLAAAGCLQDLASAQNIGAGALQEAKVQEQLDGVRVHLDNDLLAGRELDRDYTGGIGLTISGTAARDGMMSLDPLLARADALGTAADPANIYYARQFGLMAFTPQDIVTAAPQRDDRPYASMLFLSNGRMRVDRERRSAWSSSLTLGILGLSISKDLHGAVHELVGSDTPRGYDHQISAGGEPTARYTLARHHLWLASANGMTDVKTTLQGSVGYLTEASAAVTVRFGKFNTPWWALAPELTDYMASPIPLEQGNRHAQAYVFAGARIKARAYNAFLQGQLRHSEVSYSFAAVEPIVAEAWLGLVTQLFMQTELSYTLRYQTAELRHGPAARDAFWGSVQLAHSF